MQRELERGSPAGDRTSHRSAPAVLRRIEQFAEGHDGPGPGATRQERSALLAFAATTAIALPVLLALGHDQWFFGDEWYFLAGRDGGSLVDLMRPHNEHWSTLPIIAYRGLWWLFGLRTYVPYQALVVVLHLTAAVLLRVVMRRARVRAWIATAAATLFVFLGAGSQNILWAFQVGFVASVVLGLAHLLLADHDGPVDRRDVLGLVAGTAGLLCSGVAVTMTIVVGLAALVRRGWRVALLHTAPLAAIYLLWWLTIGDRYYEGPGLRSPDRFAVDLVTTNFRSAFSNMGQLPGAGLMLAVVLVAGLALRFRHVFRAELRRDELRGLATPCALLVGAGVFLIFSGVGRGLALLLLTGRLDPPRYTHLVVALSLPALAVAADTLASHHRALTPVVLALFLIGLPGNIRMLADHAPGFQQHIRSVVMVTPRLPLAREVPRETEPDPRVATQVTVGWLLDGVASGRIPEPARVTAAQTGAMTLGILVRQSNATPPSSCRPLSRPVLRQFEDGDSFGVRGDRVVVTWVPESGRGASRRYNPVTGSRFEVLTGPVDLLIEGAAPRSKVQVCL